MAVCKVTDEDEEECICPVCQDRQVDEAFAKKDRQIAELEEQIADFKAAYILVRGHLDPVEKLNEYNQRMQIAEAKLKAATEWRTDEPPKDGSVKGDILVRFGGAKFVFMFAKNNWIWVEGGSETLDDFHFHLSGKFGWLIIPPLPEEE